MEIRAAVDGDIPKIIELVRLSLGESLLPKSEVFWRWKHVDNPFGKSPVLLAFDGELLIGLRSFMNWQFRYQNKTIRAYRAVDTATHPNYQGKGIFTKLTLGLIDQLKVGEPAFIFNTPNSKSSPGYLKMGWSKVGNTRLLAKVHPWHLLQNRMMRDGVERNDEVDKEISPTIISVVEHWSSATSKDLTTAYSLDFLRWRYEQVPGIRYQICFSEHEGSQCVLIYRIKSSGRLHELRIVEIFYNGSSPKKVIGDSLHEVWKIHKPDVTTLLADSRSQLTSLLPMGFLNAQRYGLTITAREINDNGLFQLARKNSNWSVSAGTLELF